MEIVRSAPVNDTTLVSSNIADLADYALYSGATVYSLGNIVVGVDHHEYESLSGTSKGAVTISIASPGVVTCTAHGLVANTPVLLTTTGALPTGLTANTIYYVRNPATDTFELSATSGGASINTTGTQSGTHTLLANPNKGNALTDGAWWLDKGMNRRWRMFDLSNSSQSSNATTIDVSVSVTGRANAVSLLNIAADTVRIIATTVVDGTIYDQTFDLVSDSGISNWYDYFFEPIIRRGDLVVTDLPVFGDPTIQVIVTAASSTVRIGTLVIGQSLYLGATIYGARVGMQDYSRKVTDEFGNWTIVERAFAKKADFKVWMDAGKVDAAAAFLPTLRAVPCVYKGTDQYASSYIFGFFKDWNIEITTPEKSYLTLSIEGLT